MRNANLVVYDDAPENGFTDGGWGNYSLKATNYVHSGTYAASFVPSNWDGVQFNHSSFAASGYSAITFWVNGGAASGQQLWAGVTDPRKGQYRKNINSYLANGSVTANQWQQVTLPLADIGASNIQIASVYVMAGVANNQPAVYLDDFALVPAGGSGGGGAGSSTTGGSTGTTTGSTPNIPGTTTTGGSGGGGTTSGTTTGGSASGWMYTKGNHVYLANGTAWMGRGANLQDPRSCSACNSADPTQSTNEVMRRMDTLVSWGASFIRLTLESDYVESILTDSTYIQNITNIVAHAATKPGLVLEVSVWLDPSLSSSGWPTSATVQEWQVLAKAFANYPNVIFGLVNEPQNNYDGSQDSQVWTAMNNVVAAIRAEETMVGSNQHIIAVQGTGGWSRFVSYYEANPITAGGGTNIVYEVHVYDTTSDFQSIVTAPAQNIPVIISEFGPVSGSMTTTDVTNLMNLAEQNRIPYMAWTFHQNCPPNLLVNNANGGCGIGMSLQPTAWGQQMQQQLSSHTN